MFVVCFEEAFLPRLSFKKHTLVHEMEIKLLVKLLKEKTYKEMDTQFSKLLTKEA